MIIYGLNNFLIKTFRAFDLGLVLNYSDDFDVEVRQKYFHLFWIPFFGLGKIWCIRRGKDLYDLPNGMKEQINQSSLGVKSPFYTYTGLILVGFLFLFSNIQSTIDQKEFNDSVNSFENKRTENFPIRLDNLTENSYVTIGKSSLLSDFSFCKIEKIQGNNIKLLKLDKFFNTDSRELDFVLTTFNNHIAEVTEVNTTKENLKKAIGKEFSSKLKGYNDGFDIFNDGQKYYIQDVFDVDGGPHLVDRNTGSYDGNIVSIAMLNYGKSVNLIAIKNLENNINWEVKLPLEIPVAKQADDSFFNLNGIGYDHKPYKFELIFENSLKEKYKYVVESNGTHKTIKKVYQ